MFGKSSYSFFTFSNHSPNQFAPKGSEMTNGALYIRDLFLIICSFAAHTGFYLSEFASCRFLRSVSYVFCLSIGE